IEYSCGSGSRSYRVKNLDEEVSDQIERLEFGKVLKEAIARFRVRESTLFVTPRAPGSGRLSHWRRWAICIRDGIVAGADIRELSSSGTTSGKTKGNSESFTRLGSGKFVKSESSSLWRLCVDVYPVCFDVAADCVAGCYLRCYVSDRWMKAEE